MAAADSYAAADNLEIMTEAVRYNAFILDELQRRFRPGAAIVDFGAGIGTFPRLLRGKGYSVACVERDAAFASALEKDGFRVYRGLSEIPPASLDGAYTLNVLEHIEDDGAVLKALASKLKSGAALYVYVPAFQFLFSSMDAKVGHLRRYRKGELVEKMEKAGLRVAEADYVDCVGFFLSIVYKYWGNKNGDLDPGIIRFYDRWLFPLSRRLDAVAGFFFGKNLAIVGTRGSAS